MRASILVILMSGFATLAAGDVGVTVWAGAGGNVRQGATIPVVVELRNDERDRTGVVAAGFAQDAMPRTWAVQPLSLAPNARKRIFLYLPLQSLMADRIVVRYESSSGTPHAVYEEAIQVVPATLPMLAAVGQLPRGLPDPESGGNPRYRAVIVQPEILPYRFEGLEMYDVILMTPTPDIALEGEQVAALEDWVLRGGTLVVDASRRTDGLQQQELRSLLPFLPQTSEQGTVSGFDTPLVFAKGSIHNGTPLLSADGVPLIVRRNYGLGSIVCFAFDPGEPAFLAHPQRDALWMDILGTLNLDAKPQEQWQFGLGTGTVDTIMRRVADTAGTPARLGLVVLLTALYALVVGPGDYFLVKWLRRPRLTWITFPIMALAFSAAAYGGARIWFGSETVSRGFRHLTVFPELDKAIAFDAAGLFAGQSGEYDLRHAGHALWRQLQGQLDPEQSLTIDSEAARIQQRIPVWSHRVYVAGGAVDEYPEILLTPGAAGSNKVSVLNKSSFELTDCYVYSGELQGSCPSVPAGETMTIPLTPRPVVGQFIPPTPTQTNATTGQGVYIAFESQSVPPTPLQANATPPEKHDTFLGALTGGDFGPPRMDVPLGRELFAGDALRRGAMVLRASVSVNPQSPLVVNGQRCTENISYELAVVTYGSANE